MTGAGGRRLHLRGCGCRRAVVTDHAWDVSLVPPPTLVRIRAMTYPNTLRITQDRCVVEPHQAPLVALSLMAGVAEPAAPPSTQHSTALKMMGHLLDMFEHATGINQWENEFTGTSTKAVNFIARVNQCADQDTFAVLDIVTATYTPDVGARKHAAYATLSAAVGMVDDAFVALHGTHCWSGQLATTWCATAVPTSQDDVSLLCGIIGQVVDVTTQTSGRAFAFTDHLFEGRATLPNSYGGGVPYASRFVDNNDACWSLKPARYGTDIATDTAARDLTDTAIHRATTISTQDVHIEQALDDIW